MRLLLVNQWHRDGWKWLCYDVWRYFFSFREQWGALWVHIRSKWKFRVSSNTQFWGSKETVFVWLLNIEWAGRFREHLDLALAPNKTNKRVNSYPANCSEEKAKKVKRELQELPWGNKLWTDNVHDVCTKSNSHKQRTQERSQTTALKHWCQVRSAGSSALTLPRGSRQYNFFSKRPKTV